MMKAAQELYIVLDKETSGVLVVAKTRKAKEKLSRVLPIEQLISTMSLFIRGTIRIGRGTLRRSLAAVKFTVKRWLSMKKTMVSAKRL